MSIGAIIGNLYDSDMKITIEISDDLLVAAEALAASEGVTVSQVAEEGILMWLKLSNNSAPTSEPTPPIANCK